LGMGIASAHLMLKKRARLFELQRKAGEQLEQFGPQPAECSRCQRRIVLPPERDSAIRKARLFQQRGAEVTRRPDLKAFWPRLNNQIKMTVDNSSEEVHIHNQWQKNWICPRRKIVCASTCVG